MPVISNCLKNPVAECKKVQNVPEHLESMYVDSKVRRSKGKDQALTQIFKSAKSILQCGGKPAHHILPSQTFSGQNQEHNDNVGSDGHASDYEDDASCLLSVVPAVHDLCGVGGVIVIFDANAQPGKGPPWTRPDSWQATTRVAPLVRHHL